jgi:hypothetical protein
MEPTSSTIGLIVIAALYVFIGVMSAVGSVEIYWLRRQRPTGSIFSSVPLEKTLGRLFTIRGVSTVKKMVLKYSFKGA